MSKTVVIHIGPSARWARVGDLVKTLQPMIEQTMRDAVDEAMRGSNPDSMAMNHYRESVERDPLIIIDDPVLDDWRDRARAAGMTEDEIDRARHGDAPLVIDGTAKGVD